MINVEIQQIAYKNEERNYNIKFNFAGEEHEMNIGRIRKDLKLMQRC
jgi:hypothetical protein